MTVPIKTGFPDWGRYSAEATKQYVQEIGILAAADVTKGPFFVADIKYLFIASTSDQSIAVSAQFYLDAGMTKMVSNKAFDIAAGANLAVIVPVLGPYVAIQILSLVHPFHYNLQVYMSPTGDTSVMGDIPQNILFNARGVAYPAGATVLTASWVISGEAWFHAIFPARASEIRLETIDVFGTLTFVADLQGNATQPWMRVNLPPQTAQLTINNPGPGAATYWFTLIARPSAGI